MAVALPDTPDTIGTTWTNPETGVDYEWDGERWKVVVLSTNLDDVAYLSESQKFTGENIFENKTVFKDHVTITSTDNTHRLYIKDEDGNTNFSLFPNGSFTTKSHINFQPQKFSTFNERYSSYVRVEPPVVWSIRQSYSHYSYC